LPSWFPERSLLMVLVTITVIQIADWPEESRSGEIQWANPDMPAHSVTEWDTDMRRDTYPGWGIAMVRNVDIARAMVIRRATSMDTSMDTNTAVNTDASTTGVITNRTAIDF
jgi:hypothetical protein